MSHDNFQPPDVDVPPQDDEDRIYYALTDLASLDTDDVNLRDHPKAYEVLDRLMTHAYAEGRNDAADEIASLQAQLAAAQAQVVELADALRADAAAEADGVRHDEYCDRANAEGWDNDPTGSSHISSSANQLRNLQERAAALKRAALAKVGR